MSNYSYVVSHSNVSILLTTLFNRTNPPFVADIKDKNSFPTHASDTRCWLSTHAYRELIKVGYSSRNDCRRYAPRNHPPEKGRARPFNDIWATAHVSAQQLANAVTLTEQLALSRTRSLPATCHPLNRKMKKYVPTPIAAETFSNFISGTDTVRRPELFEHFAYRLKTLDFYFRGTIWGNQKIEWVLRT